MIRIKKFVVGIKSAQKMFRITSLGGSLIDAILSARGDKLLGEEYYTEVGRSHESGIVQLTNEELGNSLQVDTENVIFSKSTFSSDKRVDVERALSEFRFLWKQLNEVMRVRDIRRIGVAAEHQIPINGKSPSEVLLGKITTFVAKKNPAKFHLQLESRRHTTNAAGIPDHKRDDFINVIHHYYDSALDVDHPLSDHFNANLDVQRYYSPLLNSNIFDAAELVYRDFSKEAELLEKDLKERGLA